MAASVPMMNRPTNTMSSTPAVQQQKLAMTVFHAVYHVLRAPKTALVRTTGVQTLIYTEEHP